MDIILRYRSAPADVKRTDTENIPGRGWKADRERKSIQFNWYYFFLKSQNQFDISIFKKEAINYGFFKNLYQILSFSNMYVLLSIAV